MFGLMCVKSLDRQNKIYTRDESEIEKFKNVFDREYLKKVVTILQEISIFFVFVSTKTKLSWKYKTRFFVRFKLYAMWSVRESETYAMNVDCLCNVCCLACFACIREVCNETVNAASYLDIFCEATLITNHCIRSNLQDKSRVKAHHRFSISYVLLLSLWCFIILPIKFCNLLPNS